MPSSDPDQKSWAEDVIGTLLEQLAEWLPHAAKHSRVRVLDLIVSLLRGLLDDTALEEKHRAAIGEALHEHLADKEEKVRQMVIIAMYKLDFLANDGSDDPFVTELVAELTEALHSDISQDVRVELVARLPLDKSTLAELLRHQSDRAAKVAAAVYSRVACDVRMALPTMPGGVAASPEQRRSLLWYGLLEPRPEVRKAALGLLEQWYTEDAAKDVVALIEAVSPQANPELCRLILEQLMALQLWDPQAWLEAETAAERSLKDLVVAVDLLEQQAQQQQQSGAAGVGVGSGPNGGAAWMAGLSPATAFVWVFAARKVEEVATDSGRAAAEKVAAVVAQVEASAGAQAEMVLEAFLPTAQQMAKLCLLAAQAGPSHRYIAAQLLELASLSYMNWVDASSREAAEGTLWELITRCAGPGGAEPGARVVSEAPLPAGSRAWEAAVLRFAAAVYGGDGPGLVHGVLPLVLSLAGQDAGAGPSNRGAAEEAAGGALLQALTYLHLLMATAGPGVPPSASAPAPQEPAAAGGSGGDGARPNRSLAQAVESLAWTASGHSSPAIRAAAVRCYVELCLRDGGLAQLPRAVAMLLPMLPACHGSAGTSAYAAAAAAVDYDDEEDRDFAAQQQLPRRVALQGLMDLALTWGEPTLTAELRKAAAAVAGRQRVEAVTARLATLGMDVDAAAAEEGLQEQAAAAAAAAVTGPAAQGVVPILLRLTEGVAKRMQGSDGHVAARGVVADALLGSARLVHGWSFQQRVGKRLRHQAVTAMQASLQPRLAEQLLTRLLLARFSPSLDSEPWLRSQLSAFFKSFQEAASAPGDEGAVHRRMLAGSFLHAARCAMALPAPAGAPATARGCAAPALMEFAGELLASGAAAAIAASRDAAEDEGEEVLSASGEDPAAAAAAANTAAAAAAAAPDPVVWLCELVLEEVVRLGSPGSASLDTGEGRVRAYAAELCKTPMRLLPGLPTGSSPSSPSLRNIIRRLAFLGRRAVLAAGESLVKTVVPDTAFKKLKEFVAELEEQQYVKTAPLNEADAKAAVEALRAHLKDRLDELPSLEDVTADLEPDDEWDALTADVSQATTGAGAGVGVDQRAGAKKRGAGAKAGAAKARGGATTRTRSTTGRAASTTTASARRSDTRNRPDADMDTDDTDDDNDNNDTDHDNDSHADGDDSDSDGGGGRRRAGSAAPKAPKAPKAPARTARPAASQDTMTLSDSGSQRRSTRAAAAKASVKLEALRTRGGGN
ncbi:hypothetical protein PLESTB_000279300 [Pleodorina starrii]|uniref:Condensin complex subunit 3 n=1 Tax=Pleodorina starrii TaxID=330485 RepID=A0A9W6BDG6_9CHLO|nr:hypothetical protein PLESTB_000279300 [Pleodorina starrii]GLC76019.1 hypothetical protein PLESTF_001721200 [Pleodorina starrii]